MSAPIDLPLEQRIHMYAVFSDIHGNFAALKAAADEAEQIAQEECAHLEFICLGDVVDFGPQPVECIEWVQEHALISVQGNHDRIAAEAFDRPPIDIDKKLWPILFWTRHELGDKHKETLRSWSHPRPVVLPPFTLFHSDPDERDIYIDNSRAAKETLNCLGTPYGLFGHTHMQCYYMWDAQQLAHGIACLEDTHLELFETTSSMVPVNQWTPFPSLTQPIIFNPGSIGQPRNQGHPDHRAAYMLLRKNNDQSWDFRFQRTNYPYEETVRLLLDKVRCPELSKDELQLLSTLPQDNPLAVHLTEIWADMPAQLAQVTEYLIRLLKPAEVRD